MKLTITLFAVLIFGAIATAASVETMINECWEGNDHRGMSECVSNRAATARTNLEIVENEVRAAIPKNNESGSYIKTAKDRFEASVQSYRKYRRDQCQLREALASVGNGAAENRMACEAELDTKRAEELEADIWWIKK